MWCTKGRESMNLEIFALLLSYFVVVYSDENTLSCVLKNGRRGQCILLKNCPSALNDIKKNVSTVTCMSGQKNPIVCCDMLEGLSSESRSEKNCMDMHSKYPRAYQNSTYVPLGIVGGINSLSKEFKHMAALGYGEKNSIVWACGGSLISERYILTAAHCAKTQILGDVKFIRLGDLNLKINTDDAEPQDFRVKRVIRHPQHKPPSKYHDIALIELDKPVRITAYVKPACLHTTTKISSSVLIATGWGHMEYGGTITDHLQRVNLREYGIAECKKSYKPSRKIPNGIVHDSQICAGGLKKDSCQGDSGGPLQIKDSSIGNYRIIGVTSFGQACGISTAPGVYTRVSNYIKWIESIVWPN